MIGWRRNTERKQNGRKLDLWISTTIIDYIFFSGQKQLLQFTIGNPEFHLSNNGSLLKAVFTLHRIPSYILINTYIPSFFIMLMTVVPLYLKDDTQYATTMVLLNILCLYTVLQSSRDGIPKTAYLKVSKSQKHLFYETPLPKKGTKFVFDKILS